MAGRGAWLWAYEGWIWLQKMVSAATSTLSASVMLKPKRWDSSCAEDRASKVDFLGFDAGGECRAQGPAAGVCRVRSRARSSFSPA